MSSESESESEEEKFESLIATRQRRSNAGSRLKQLLQLEEDELDEAGSFQTEDDENVKLLFQEDEGDQEFMGESEGESNEEEEEEEEGGDDEENDEKVIKGTEEQEQPTQGVSDDESPREYNSDEMLSDSDLSQSDSDESEGERALQREERKKKKRSTTTQIPAIAKPKRPAPASDQKPKKKRKSEPDLLSMERRSSSRRATVENTIETQKKVTEMKERQSKVKPKPKEEYIPKTLKENLEEAKKTEEENTLSLNLFFQQEVEKKKKQRDMLNSKRFKLIEFVSFKSARHFVTPLEEVEEVERQRKKAEEEERLRNSRKRRYGRRKKGEVNQDGSDKTQDEAKEGDKIPDEVKEGEAPAESQELSRVIEEESGVEVAADNGEVKMDVGSEGKGEQAGATDKKVDSYESETKDDANEVELKEEVANEVDLKEDIADDVKMKEESVNGSGLKEDNANEVELKEDPAIETDGGSEKEETDVVANENGSVEKEETDGANTHEIKKDIETQTPQPEEEPSESTEPKSEDLQSPLKKEEKKVKFADEEDSKDQMDIDVPADSEEAGAKEEVPEEIPEEEEKPIYEGPSQCVAVNYISLEHFSKELGITEIKKILLGPQSILPGSRRDPHARPIYTIKSDTQKDIDLQKFLRERESTLQNILKLPKFGEKYKQVEGLQEEKPQEEQKITITTPAPMGIYLPNGSKKRCSINGDYAMYYDPSNGVPYNSVEGYKVLKNLASGGYYWAQINNGGINSVFKGGVGCYFGAVNGRHAKGVPEGFE